MFPNAKVNDNENTLKCLQHLGFYFCWFAAKMSPCDHTAILIQVSASVPRSSSAKLLLIRWNLMKSSPACFVAWNYYKRYFINKAPSVAGHFNNITFLTFDFLYKELHLFISFSRARLNILHTCGKCYHTYFFR